MKNSVVEVAQELLGKLIISNVEGKLAIGRIVETEAYDGIVDKACHAYPGKRTARTEVMFQEGGIAYVYLCYGIHHLFNVVTQPKNTPSAVLIRAIEPISGISYMKERRKSTSWNNLTNGPAKCAQALGISGKDNQLILHDCSSRIWLGEDEIATDFQIVKTTRIGVDYAGEDAFLPWRFYIENNSFVSKK